MRITRHKMVTKCIIWLFRHNDTDSVKVLSDIKLDSIVSFFQIWKIKDVKLEKGKAGEANS